MLNRISRYLNFTTIAQWLTWDVITRHLVDDWKQCHKFFSNWAFWVIGILALFEQYGGEFIEPKYMFYVALAGFILRMWNQGRPNTTTGAVEPAGDEGQQP